MPFDGDIDYKKMMDSLNKIGYKGSLMLEIFCPNTMTAEEFVKTAYERAERLSKL